MMNLENGFMVTMALVGPVVGWVMGRLDRNGKHLDARIARRHEIEMRQLRFQHATQQAKDAAMDALANWGASPLDGLKLPKADDLWAKTRVWLGAAYEEANAWKTDYQPALDTLNAEGRR